MSAPLPVQLIRPILAPGRNGPINGMYALQKALRRRIAEGLEWLTIGRLSVRDGALPWFWHWDNRAAAVSWDARGLPFVQGPNMLFTFSWKPRIDRLECGLLDAAGCRAMFCHSPWYRDLIAKHRGEANRSPIVLWPYPIDPWPGEPLPDVYDLLIYVKRGRWPALVEHLTEQFPRHVRIHYGRYSREKLFEAARRSRACAYLGEDDHGPLALQEILLAGCPVVGVRKGAPLIEHGVTGLFIAGDRLPRAGQRVPNDADRSALAAYLDAIRRVQQFDRQAVRAAAARQFDTERIVETILAALDRARR